MNSNKAIWTPENGALLQQLRINANIDIGTLAQRNMVSRIQVVQLEEGGDSAFYSPEIKLQVGKKLLGFFGHTLKPRIALRSEPPLTEEPTSFITSAETDALEVKDSVIESEKVDPPSTQPVTETPDPVAPRFRPVQRKALILVLIVLVLWLFQFLFPNTFVWRDFSLDKPVKAEAPDPNQTVAAVAPVVTAEKPLPLPEPTSQATSQTDNLPKPMANVGSDSSVAATQLQPMSETAKKCTWQDTDIELQAPSPKKPAEYVYLIASKDVFVCVMDGKERVASILLKKDEGRSIYGPAPFKINSTEFANLKVFFQGQSILIPDENARQIKLTAAALNR